MLELVQFLKQQEVKTVGTSTVSKTAGSEDC